MEYPLPIHLSRIEVFQLPFSSFRLTRMENFGFIFCLNARVNIVSRDFMIVSKRKQKVNIEGEVILVAHFVFFVFFFSKNNRTHLTRIIERIQIKQNEYDQK